MASKAADRWSTRKLTRLTLSALYESMDREPRIVASQSRAEGLQIEFDDGTIGTFPAALLYAILPQAISLQREDIENSART